MIYLDYSATTPLTKDVKKYIIELLDDFYNPSSLYQGGANIKEIIRQARNNVGKFINGNPNNIIFTSSGSAANSLVIKGLTSENPKLNKYQLFYSPTAHKSMINACESCLYYNKLKVDSHGEIDIEYLDDILSWLIGCIPLVCVEWANSEIGTINNIEILCDIVHKHNGVIVVDATGYIPSCEINMGKYNMIDYLTFSGHKLNALKGVGVLYKNNDSTLKPLVYGSQEAGIFGGTENVLSIASLGKSVESYDYKSISSKNRDYVYEYIIQNIEDCYLVGKSIEDRMPNNLYMCFKGVNGKSLMTLMDLNGIQISTGSACNNYSSIPSNTLTAIKMNENDINNCVRLSFSGNETSEELDYICNKLNECVDRLR